MATKTRRPRRTSEERKAQQLEALRRAQAGNFCQNDVMVIMEFEARGIPVEEITPRENVLTFNAWKAKGRYVRKGEKGVKLTTWIPVKDKDGAELTDGVKKHTRPVTTTVFHISQTEPCDGAPAAEATPEPEAPVEPVIVAPLAIEFAGWINDAPATPAEPETIEAEFEPQELSPAKPRGFLF